MRVIKTNLEIIRGDTLSFLFELVPSEGEEEYNLDSAYFSIKENISDEDYILQKSLGQGIELLGGNQYRVKASPEDTKKLEEGIYNYDLQISLNGDIQTILIGMIKVVNDITKEA